MKPDSPNSNDTRLDDDDPIDLAPNQEDEENPTIYRPRRSQHDAIQSNGDRRKPKANSDASSSGEHASSGAGSRAAPRGPDASTMVDPLHWALDTLHQPAMASADWLARDI